MQGQLIGKYRLVRLLGEGGMGVVWEAERDDLGGRVALKILRTEYAQQAEFSARFFNEAHATNAIDHPAMVKVFDHGQTPDGAAFLAMEFVAGESLASRLEKTPRLPTVTVMRLGRQVASAIAAAHAKTIIHRGPTVPSRGGFAFSEPVEGLRKMASLHLAGSLASRCPQLHDIGDVTARGARPPVRMPQKNGGRRESDKASHSAKGGQTSPAVGPPQLNSPANDGDDLALIERRQTAPAIDILDPLAPPSEA